MSEIFNRGKEYPFGFSLSDLSTFFFTIILYTGEIFIQPFNLAKLLRSTIELLRILNCACFIQMDYIGQIISINRNKKFVKKKRRDDVCAFRFIENSKKRYI